MSGGGGGLEFDHEFGHGQAGDAEQGGGWFDAGVGEAGEQDAVVLEDAVHVGGVDGQADHVAEGHACFGEDGLQVVEAEGELGRHVAGVLGFAVGVG